MNSKIRTLSRNWHRDLAYLFVGLIISFSISGIALNHRRVWNPRQYVYQSEEIKLNLPQQVEDITDEYVQSILPQLNIDKKFRSHRIQNGELRIFFVDALVEIDLATGEGQKEWFKKRPLLADMTLLHQTTNDWWIWYSDIFGLGMIIIAVSGMFISGENIVSRREAGNLLLPGSFFHLSF